VSAGLEEAAGDWLWSSRSLLRSIRWSCECVKERGVLLCMRRCPIWLCVGMRCA
jgi:hypothetical protein